MCPLFSRHPGLVLTLCLSNIKRQNYNCFVVLVTKQNILVLSTTSFQEIAASGGGWGEKEKAIYFSHSHTWVSLRSLSQRLLSEGWTVQSERSSRYHRMPRVKEDKRNEPKQRWTALLQGKCMEMLPRESLGWGHWRAIKIHPTPDCDLKLRFQSQRKPCQLEIVLITKHLSALFSFLLPFAPTPEDIHTSWCGSLGRRRAAQTWA